MTTARCGRFQRNGTAFREGWLGTIGLGIGLFLLLADPGWVANRVAAQDLVATTEPLEPAAQRLKLRVPDGFEIQLVAAEPDIQKPLNLAFDARGRLWVTDTVEYPYPAEEGTVPRDTLKILEDFGPDGRARRITTFAAQLNIPIGVLPWGNGAIGHSIPQLWRFRDLDDDGRADLREALLGPFGYRDTHGMVSHLRRGFDGWIHCCHGFANDSEIRDRRGRVLRLNSGNTFRFRLRPEGVEAEHATLDLEVEPFTFGQVNPFGLAFDAWGDLYSCDCHSQPLYLLMREGCYPSFGKPDDGLGFTPEVTLDDHGSTGIAGVVVYEADHFPDLWRGTVFIGNPVTSRINHDRLEWNGSTPRVVRQPDFVVSDDPWFRPVDLRLGPDGALYVADFYNRIIGHYEVPLTHPGRDRHRGRIWRIVHQGQGGRPLAPIVDRRRADAERLIADLDDANLEVRLTATHELVDRFQRDPSNGLDRRLQEALETSGTGNHNGAPPKIAPLTPIGRTHALWALQRMGRLTDTLTRTFACDPDPLVRTHLMRMLGDRAPETWTEAIRALAHAGLNDPHPRVRRAAAEALSRHPQAVSVAPLIAAIRAVDANDPLLRHGLRIALRNQLRDDSAAAWHRVEALGEADPSARAIAADVAVGVPSARAAAFLMACLEDQTNPVAPNRREASIRHIARHGDDPVVAALIGWIAGTEVGGAPLRGVAALSSYAEGARQRGRSLDPRALDQALTLCQRLLESSESTDETIRAATDLAKTLKLTAIHADLLAFARQTTRPAHQRAWVLAAAAELDPPATVETLAAIVTDRSEFWGLRAHMGDVLAGLQPERSRPALLEALGDAPLNLQTPLAASLARDPAGAAALVEAIEAGRVSRLVLKDRTVEMRLLATRGSAAAEELERLRMGMPDADQALQELIERRRARYREIPVDVARGRAVFEQHCASCHMIGNQGGKVGPQLDGVAIRGPDRLHEDILDPSRNVDQAFRLTTLVLASGQVVSGLVVREEGQLIVLADADGRERAYDAHEIDERVVSNLSPMPANFGERLDETELAHLIQFLVAQPGMR